MNPYEDGQRQTHQITEVKGGDKGWSVTMDNGWSFWIPKNDSGVEPSVGDPISLYGRGFGSPVRGVMICGKFVFYESETEFWDRRDREAKEEAVTERADYLANQDATNAKLANLPDVFQKRIARFLKNSDEAWKYQGYEMACCNAALLIAKECDGDAARIADYGKNYSYSHEVEELGLSGNQFGMACRLAYWYLAEPDNVWREHAAIANLVGDEAAGSVPGED